MTAEMHYDGLMDPVTLQKWADARTLRNLAELTAQWLEGTLPSQVGYAPNVGPDDETTELIPVLVALNRAGILTDCSQPAFDGPAYEGTHVQQRAAVSGVLPLDDPDEELLDLLRRAVADTPLRLAVRFGGGEPLEDDGIVVTTWAGEPYTWLGREREFEEVEEESYAGCHPDAVEEVWDGYDFVIYDPVWGRNDLLWPALAKVLAG